MYKDELFFTCFDLRVTDPFYFTFYYVEKRNGMLRKNNGEGFEKSYVAYPCRGVGGSKTANIILSN